MFLISVVFALAVAFVTERVVTGYAQTTSENAYASGTSRP